MRPSEEEVNRFARKGNDVERSLALKRHIESEIDEDPETLIFDKIKESE